MPRCIVEPGHDVSCRSIELWHGAGNMQCGMITTDCRYSAVDPRNLASPTRRHRVSVSAFRMRASCKQVNQKGHHSAVVAIVQAESDLPADCSLMTCPVTLTAMQVLVHGLMIGANRQCEQYSRRTYICYRKSTKNIRR